MSAETLRCAARSRERVASARLRLMLERPFLGSLVAHLPIVETDRCRSFATDARCIYANLVAVAEWPEDKLRFTLAHLTLHCALGHLERRGRREHTRWHAACDHAVNQLLLEDGVHVPPQALVDRRFRGLSAEEIYARLEPGLFESAALEPEHLAFAPPAGEVRAARGAGSPESGLSASASLKDGRSDGASPEGPAATRSARPGSPDPAFPGESARRWRERVALSAAAVQAGRGLGKVWRDLLGSMQPERLSWRTVLARFMTSLGTEDFTYARPSRREGEALLPGRASPTIDLVAALDTSGSVDDGELAGFLAELQALKSQVRARLAVLACDQELAEGSPWRLEPHEPLSLPPLGGGGGTRFAPVFDWVERQGHPPQALIYLTDALGEFPPHPPAYPVLWIVKGPGQVPWGERIALTPE